MIDINSLRNTTVNIVTIGSNPAIIQSILDFDYISGKKNHSIRSILATGRNFERYFFGQKEILIPVFATIENMPDKLRESCNFFLNLSSGRRVLSSIEQILKLFPNISGGVIFAENVPEKHALILNHIIYETDKFIIGPSSIGLLIPGVIKLGAIGGVDVRQLIESKLFTPGSVSVLSSSGGMTNEIINTVVQSGKRISFSLSFGGERFPITTPKEAFLSAENDVNTKTIIYFGELGGTDENEVVELLKAKQISKNIICYIAGTVAEMFEIPPQFGHAKALAESKEETARNKRKLLKDAGAIVANSYIEFLNLIKDIKTPTLHEEKNYSTILEQMTNRRSALITSSISSDKEGQPYVLGDNLLTLVKKNSFAAIVASLLLGRRIKSKTTEHFVDFVLRLLVDHGPYVSGSVNSIITARAGRDLVSSLAAGLLTIGPRFGGAINQAAGNWLNGVLNEKDPSDFVEEFASKRQYIAGIGHKKYRIDLPDPRVVELKKFAESLHKKRFTNFALDVEKVTTAKKGNLILNVDGVIACIFLDILSEEEEIAVNELRRLVDIEFFNSLFILSRSVGFISHALDQKRLDEGIFRMPEELVTDTNINE